jgi:hypothetical protein
MQIRRRNGAQPVQVSSIGSGIVGAHCSGSLRIRSLRALMAANSRCTHIVAAMPHPKPTTNIVITLASPPILGAPLPRACDGITKG